MDKDDVTALLERSRAGDEGALRELMPLVYEELRVIARAQRRQSPNNTLNTTALVHEAYVKLLDRERLDCADRRRFYAYVAQAMRNILLDGARRRAALKRGGDLARDDEAAIDELPAPEASVDVLRIDEALRELQRLDARLAEVVELHVFAGLEFGEIAECLGLTERTVYRDWRKARAVLGTSLGAD